MQCSLCTNVALRVVGTGKKQIGFCGVHAEDAFIAARKQRPKIAVKNISHTDYCYGDNTGLMPRGRHLDRKSYTI